jgi:hypothetical protein
MDYAKLLEMNSFFTWHIFLQVGKTQDLSRKIWQTLGVALNKVELALVGVNKRKGLPLCMRRPSHFACEPLELPCPRVKSCILSGG